LVDRRHPSESIHQICHLTALATVGRCARIFNAQIARAARPVGIVIAGNRLAPLKLRAFIDYAAPRLAERLRSISATIGPNPL